MVMEEEEEEMVMEEEEQWRGCRHHAVNYWIQIQIIYVWIIIIMQQWIVGVNNKRNNYK